MSLIISKPNLVFTSNEMLMKTQNERGNLLIGTNTFGRLDYTRCMTHDSRNGHAYN